MRGTNRELNPPATAMATPIRECLLDSDNKPIFARVARVNAAIRDAFPDGCPVVIKHGKRKGQHCGHPIRCNAWGNVQCRVHTHATAAYAEPYSKVVFEVINDIEQNGDEFTARLQQQDEARRAEHEAQREKRKREMTVRFARREAEQRGVEFHTDAVKPRPDGKAPVGRTWSYLDGKWVDSSDRPTKRAKTGEA